MLDGWPLLPSTDTKMASRSSNLRKKRLGQTPGGRKLYLVNQGKTIRMQGAQPLLKKPHIAQAGTSQLKKEKITSTNVAKKTPRVRSLQPSNTSNAIVGSPSEDHSPSYAHSSLHSSFSETSIQLSSLREDFPETLGVTIEGIDDLGECLENGIGSNMMDKCILDVNADNLTNCLDVQEPTNILRDDVPKNVKQELLSRNAFSNSAKEVHVAEIFTSEPLLSEPSASLQQETYDSSQEVFLGEPDCQLLIKKEWVPPEEQILPAEESFSASDVFTDTVIKQEPLLDEVSAGHDDPLQLIQLYVNHSDGLTEEAVPSGEPPPQLLQHSQFLLDDQKLTLSPVTFLSTDASQDCSVSAAGFGDLADPDTLAATSLSLAMPCSTLQPVLMSTSLASSESSAICSTSNTSIGTEFILPHSVFSEPNNSSTFNESSVKPSAATKPLRKITIRSIQQTQTSPATASKFLLSREVKSSVASKMCQTSDEGPCSSSFTRTIGLKEIKTTANEMTSSNIAGTESIVSKIGAEKNSTTLHPATPKITMVPSRRDRGAPSAAARPNSKRGYTKVDKEDPRSRLHYVKYMKKDGKTIKKWECGMCGREFIHQYTLMRHLPTHTDERNFTCDQCGKAFRQMSTLSQHRSTHSQFRPYVCDICQKTFTRVSTLISHKKLHDGVKPHVCSVCGKAFHQKGNLKNHMFIHTNERPYKCHQCGRGFNQASNLHSHKIRAHSDSSPLVLSPADVARVQSLSDSVSSTMGLNNTESAPPLKCLQCPLTFGNKATMKRHEIAAHSKFQHLMPKKQGRGTGAAPAVQGSKRCKVGSVRMVEVPGGDEAFQQLLQGGRSSDQADQFLADDLTAALRLSRPARSCLLIPAIRTCALASVVASGKTPFALLKPAASPPVVVRVALLSHALHALLPASAAQLREASQFSVAGRGASTKAVQIKIPVVATVVEKLSASGEASIEILAPDNEESAAPMVKPKTYAAPSAAAPKASMRRSLPTSASSGLLANVRASINTIAPKPASTSHTQITADYLSVTASDLPSGVLTSQLGPQTLAVESDIMVQSVPDVVLESTEDVCPTTVPELLGSGGEQLVLEAYGGDGAAAGHLMHYSGTQQDGEESHLLYLRPEEQQHLPETGLRYLRATETPLEFEMVAPDDPRLTHVVDHLGRLQPLADPLHAETGVGEDSNSSNTSGIAASIQENSGVTQVSESSMIANGGAAAAAVDGDAGAGAHFSLDNISGNSCRITLSEAGGFTIESEGGSVSLGGEGAAMDMANIAAIIGALQRAGLPVQLQSNSAGDPSVGAAQLAVVGGSHVAVADGGNHISVADVDASHMTVANVIDGSHMTVADDLSIVDDGGRLSEATEDCRSSDSHHVTGAGNLAISEDGHLRVGTDSHSAEGGHMAVDHHVEDATDPSLLPSSAVPELVEDAAHSMLIAEESVIAHRDLGPDDSSVRH